jgi:diguanylate cyclase (GGDEF)-like protein/PAS domain S-box-containing protein
MDQAGGYLLICSNISDQKKAELELHQSVALTRATVESSENGLLVIDRDFDVILSNRRLGILFDMEEGWERSARKPLETLVNLLTDQEAFYSALERLMEDPAISQTVAFDLKKGKAVECNLTSYKIDGEEIGWLLSFHDISEHKKADDKLRELAITDSLTGVYNRRYFFQLAETELERSYRYDRDLSIILLDIDYFKQINDTFGHLIGDQVLEALSVRCRRSLRVFDSIGRFGGEEFIILLPETNLTDAAVIAERLREQVENIMVVTPKGNASTTISLGVAAFEPGQPLSLDKLLAAADQALYIAKDGGRNRVQLQIQQEPLPGFD